MPLEEQTQPPQHQDGFPGIQNVMTPAPTVTPPGYTGSGKLAGKVALITGADSGIGRSVAVLFAREGADIAASYLNEQGDAAETRSLVEAEGRKCLLLPGDITSEPFCRSLVDRTLAAFGHLDVLVNNAAFQQPQASILDITEEQLDKTFRTNIYALFFLTKAALPHLPPGSSIINTASVTAFRGEEGLIDYSATKGAMLTFTRSLSASLVKQGIRVNSVAPGPIWTPLIPATYSAEEVARFGTTVPMKRVGQPSEIAPSFVFLASDDASYMTGPNPAPQRRRSRECVTGPFTRIATPFNHPSCRVSSWCWSNTALCLFPPRSARRSTLPPCTPDRCFTSLFSRRTGPFHVSRL